MGLIEKILFIILLLVIVLLLGWGLAERKLRKKAEMKLSSTKNLLETLKKLLKGATDMNTVKIILEAYFGEPIDFTGDGFIDLED